jgi:hypothetical protein
VDEDGQAAVFGPIGVITSWSRHRLGDQAWRVMSSNEHLLTIVDIQAKDAVTDVVAHDGPFIFIGP